MPGHFANVQCVEVWCPMTAAFYREYLRHGGAGLGNKESVLSCPVRVELEACCTC